MFHGRSKFGWVAGSHFVDHFERGGLWVDVLLCARRDKTHYKTFARTSRSVGKNCPAMLQKDPQRSQAQHPPPASRARAARKYGPFSKSGAPGYKNTSAGCHGQAIDDGCQVCADSPQSQQDRGGARRTFGGPPKEDGGAASDPRTKNEESAAAKKASTVDGSAEKECAEKGGESEENVRGED